MASNKLTWRINEQIHAPKVRVIDAKGKQIGVLTKNKALEKAKKAGKDLVEIAPKAKPPVTKIIEFGKFKYQQEKKARKQKKKSKAPELKEVRFSPFIGDADYQTRIERIKEFLDEKNKVRVVVKFKGRQMGSKQYGYKIIEKIVNEFEDQITLDMKPKFIGRHLTTVISPTNKPTKEKKVNSKNKKKAKNGKTKNKKVS